MDSQAENRTVETERETREGNNARVVKGTPLDLRSRLNPSGIQEVIIDYGEDDRDVVTSRTDSRKFEAYELYQMSLYFKDLAGQQKRTG